jgi:hypothetical protein
VANIPLPLMGEGRMSTRGSIQERRLYFLSGTFRSPFSSVMSYKHLTPQFSGAARRTQSIMRDALGGLDVLGSIVFKPSFASRITQR